MDNVIRPRINFESIGLFVFVVSLFFVSEDVLVFGTLDSSVMLSLRYVIQILSFLALLFICINKKLINDNNFLCFIVILSVLIFASMLVNLDFRPGYFLLFITLMSAYLVLRLYSLDRIFDLFYKIMLFLCLFSLVIFVIRLSKSQLLYYAPIIVNIAGNPFRFFVFANTPVWQDSFIRNYGLFREPGVFQIYIIVALIYGIFRKKDSSVLRLLVFISSVFTTFSTTGYIALSIILVAMIIKKDYSKKTKTSLLIISLVGFLGLTFGTDLVFGYGYGSVFGKIAAGTNSGSYRSRLSSTFFNIEMFLENPFFGMGLTYVNEGFPVKYEALYGYRSIDNTNTIFIQLARFGLAYAILFVYSFFKISFRYFEMKNKISSFLISLALLLLLSGENLSYSFLTIILFVGSFDVRINMVNSEATKCNRLLYKNENN